MKFKIPFDEDLFIYQTKLTIPFVYSDLYRRRKQSLISGILFILLGAIILAGDADIGVLFAIIGVIMLFDFFLKNNKYNEYKNAYLDASRKMISNKSHEISYGMFDFADEHLIYMDDHVCSKTNWSDFEEYRVVNSNLLLMRNKLEGDILVLGKKEIDPDKFDLVVEYVKQKII